MTLVVLRQDLIRYTSAALCEGPGPTLSMAFIGVLNRWGNILNEWIQCDANPIYENIIKMAKGMTRMADYNVTGQRTKR